MAKAQIALKVNGKAVDALVEPRTLLIHFLREQLNLTGPHIGCDTSHCGACTVDLNGKSVKSCTMFARHQPLRRLHRRSQRQVGEVLHDVRRAGRRRGGADDRGHGRA